MDDDVLMIESCPGGGYLVHYKGATFRADNLLEATKQYEEMIKCKSETK